MAKPYLERMVLGQLTQSFTQLGVVLLVCMFVYGFARLFKLSQASARAFLGFTYSSDIFKSANLIFWFGGVIFAVCVVLGQFYGGQREFLFQESSPYYKILRSGFGPYEIAAGVLYAFVSSGFTEEIFFRGLFAKRLFNRLRFWPANILQAIVFWSLHFALIWAVTGELFSSIQALGFVTSFGLSAIGGWMNEKTQSKSILPSCILHSLLNFSTFCTLGFLSQLAKL